MERLTTPVNHPQTDSPRPQLTNCRRQARKLSGERRGLRLEDLPIRPDRGDMNAFLETKEPRAQTGAR